MWEKKPCKEVEWGLGEVRATASGGRKGECKSLKGFQRGKKKKENTAGAGGTVHW